MKGALKLVKQKYPRIEMLGCGCHQLNLAIGDLLKLEPFQQTLKDAIMISKWWRNHHIPLAKLKKRQLKKLGTVIPLCLPVATRWQSNCATLSALLKAKDCLRVVANNSRVSAILSHQKRGKHIRKQFTFSLMIMTMRNTVS